MRIVIIGASGLIGTALETLALAAAHEVIGTYATKPRDGLKHFDVTQDDLTDGVPDLGPDDSVVLMSAVIDQAWVQANPGLSRSINVNGAIACAASTFRCGAHFVYMSSEAVFGLGNSSDGFDEAATPVPLSLYARQKVEVEDALFLMQGRWCIVRTGSVIGWRPQDTRDSVSATYRTLLSPNAKMAHDNVFTVTDVTDVASGLLRVVEGKVRGILHLAANPPVSRTYLADLIIAGSRFKSEMNYERVSFMAVGNGLRAKRGWLRNEQAVGLGYKFADPRLVIDRKVKFLDESH